jgi:hypothetical protein
MSDTRILSTHAILNFKKSLLEKEYVIKKISEFSFHSGRSQKVYQTRIEVLSGDVFQIVYWKQLYQLMDTDVLSSDYAKDRDKKLKSVLKTFGFGNADVLGTQMDSVLDLLSLEIEGKSPFLIFLIKDGRCLWCGAREFYEFVMRYSSMLENGKAYGGEFCFVPVRWLKDWNHSPKKAFPIVDLMEKING